MEKTQIQKPSATIKPAYILFVIDDQNKMAVKYSQPKQSFCKMFSCHKFSDKVEQVVTEGYLDGNKVIHSIALYDDDKIYIQAKNIFEANVKFQKFITHKNNLQNEKEKIETANQELPQ